MLCINLRAKSPSLSAILCNVDVHNVIQTVSVWFCVVLLILTYYSSQLTRNPHCFFTLIIFFDREVVGKPFSVILIILHTDYYFKPSLKGPCHRSPYLRFVCLEAGSQSGMRKRYKSESRVGMRETVFKPLSHNEHFRK